MQLIILIVLILKWVYIQVKYEYLGFCSYYNEEIKYYKENKSFMKDYTDINYEFMEKER